MTVRYGLIGAGMMGQEHLRNLALIEGAEVTALADPDEGTRTASTALAGPAAKAFSDYKEMLSADLCDAYMIVGPNDLHHAMMTDALATGKPILCEKPLCTTSRDCRDLVAKAHGCAPVWVAMEYRYMPSSQRLLADLEAGRAGKLHMVSIREHRYPFLDKVGDWNRFNARTGGTMVEKCCHFWDLMRLITRSDPVRVYASAAMNVNHADERYGGKQPDIIDNGYVIVDFENGTRGMMDLCMFAEAATWQEIITVTGNRARLETRVPRPGRFEPDGIEREAEYAVADRASLRETVETVHVDDTLLKAGDHHGSTFFQHRGFFEMVRSGKGTPAVTLEDGLWSVLTGEAAEMSAREDRAVTLSELK
ncbi:Gfo/Idh/MocA family protein [Pseudoruegeria sp. HB172150]|uniref:Gfo/Idh/MocA family protein n=1 Tax=Pseudoruegeria sp. HB172150 TaxID=2721164 RepID=UPI0015574D72|nr:Gfo/Idh/MocA family oxidoreductase [Pseudoruegeria sp. HB172150]